MESKIIKAFFDGTLSDEMIDVPTTTEYDKIDARETELYEKLRATLSAEQIKLFDEFVEQYSYRHSLIAESYYVRVLNSASASPSNVSTSPTLTQEVNPFDKANTPPTLRRG